MWFRARNLLAALWRLTAPYFCARERIVLRIGPFFVSVAERWIGLALLGSVVAIELGQVWLAVLLNRWNAQFYDALQNKDLSAFWWQLAVFCVIATVFIAASVYQLYLNQWLQIRWRRWMTDLYVRHWLQHSTHYRMRIRGDAADNPDQRIAEDLALFVGRTLSLSLGVLSAATTLVSFGVILWGISSRVPFEIDGQRIAIEGYLLWIAMAFALVASFGAHFIGRPLAQLDFNRQRYEADLRFALVRLRENSEQVALLRGEAAEGRLLDGRVLSIVGNWYAIMRRQKALTFFTAGYNQVAVVLPFLIMAPHYFSGLILLGTLTQTAGAFGQVQSALSFFVNSYSDLAEWTAVVGRLSGFQSQIDQSNAATQDGLRVKSAGSGALLSARVVSLATPAGRLLLDSLSFRVRAGESLLLRGPSGIGKTTLLRAIMGIWPYANGSVTTRSGAQLFALPQKPYIPLATLRAALTYPAEEHSIDDDEVRIALAKVGLGALVPRLDVSDRWSDILSLGEQQRLSIARALLAKPDILLLDEATSALDEAAEAHLICLLKRELPAAALVSVGHRASLLPLQDRVLEVDGGERRPSALSAVPQAGQRVG